MRPKTSLSDVLDHTSRCGSRHIAVAEPESTGEVGVDVAGAWREWWLAILPGFCGGVVLAGLASSVSTFVSASSPWGTVVVRSAPVAGGLFALVCRVANSAARGQRPGRPSVAVLWCWATRSGRQIRWRRRVAPRDLVWKVLVRLPAARSSFERFRQQARCATRGVSVAARNRIAATLPVDRAATRGENPRSSNESRSRKHVSSAPALHARGGWIRHDRGTGCGQGC